MSSPKIFRFREIAPERLAEFTAKGYRERHFFPYRSYCLPKCGPDGYKLAQRMCGPTPLDCIWQLSIYAHPTVLQGLPTELFFNDTLIWHQQQLGKEGLAATATLVLKGDALFVLAPHSDLVQRASRFPAYRTQLQKRFKGWTLMLYNAVLGVAQERGVQHVHIPTADLAIRNTDRNRRVGRALFERIYGQDVLRAFSAHQDNEWWVVDVGANQARLVRPQPGQERASSEKTICVCHDIERGWGHLESDTAFAARAAQTAPDSLERMLAIEQEAGVSATYSVVGMLLPEVRTAIESSGHCLAFHSYDHQRLEDQPQLPRCREVDYRIKGYRPPQSKITAELSDESLCWHNFEWLASSASSLRIKSPELQSRLVKIPISFDDYAMYSRGMAFADWQISSCKRLEQSDFIAFSLHDCYAPLWLDAYPGFLQRIMQLGRLRTLDQVAAELFLSHAV